MSDGRVAADKPPRGYTLVGYLWCGIYVSAQDAASLASFDRWPALPLFARTDAVDPARKSHISPREGPR